MTRYVTAIHLASTLKRLVKDKVIDNYLLQFIPWPCNYNLKKQEKVSALDLNAHSRTHVYTSVEDTVNADWQPDQPINIYKSRIDYRSKSIKIYTDSYLNWIKYLWEFVVVFDGK